MTKRLIRKSNRAPARAKTSRERLLYRRDEVAAMLGISISTVIRLENDGRLQGQKLGSKNSLTVYRAADVHRLAGVESV